MMWLLMATPNIFRFWRAFRLFDFVLLNFVSKDLAQSSACGYLVDSFHPLGVALKNRSKFKKMVRKYNKGLLKRWS